MLRWTVLVPLAAVTLLAAGAGADDPPLTTVRVVTGLERPVLAAVPPGDPHRAFIGEQYTGLVKVVDLTTGDVAPVPFLSVPDLPTGYHDGLLNLVFAPDYETSGRFYLDSLTADNVQRIARGTVSEDPYVANRGLEDLLTIEHPFIDHRGGGMAFGPDGSLYVAIGDGLNAYDPLDHGQDLSVLFGKILRLDVSGPGPYEIPPDNPFVGDPDARDEIWAFGLRNPWRMSFDALTGDLYVGDVGQWAFEEINFQPAASRGGENYGWKCREGFDFARRSETTPCDTCEDPTCPFVDPVYAYPREVGRSVMGGVVYRGCSMPELHGTYFLADHYSHQVISFRVRDGVATEVVTRTSELAPDVGLLRTITSFFTDGYGELYMIRRHPVGEVYKLVRDGPAPGDLDGDASIALPDLLVLLSTWGVCAAPPAACPADFDGDGVVGIADLLVILSSWRECG